MVFDDLAGTYHADIVRPTLTKTRRPVRPLPMPEFPEPSARPRRASERDVKRPLLRRPGVVIGGAITLVLIVGAVVAAWLTNPVLDLRGPRTLTAAAAPELRLDVRHPASISADDISATIDGEAVDAPAIDIDGSGRIAIQAPKLADGEHTARVTVRGAGLTQRTLRTSWSFTVDTVAPATRIALPAAGKAPVGDTTYVPAGTIAVTKQPLRVQVATEDGASISVSSTVAGSPREQADATGPHTAVSITLPEGAQELIVRSSDPAGNTTERRQKVIVDTTGPKLTAVVPTLVRDAALNLPVAISDLHGATLQVRMNGVEIENAVTIVSRTDAPGAADASSDGGGTTADGAEAAEAAGDDDSATDDGDDADASSDDAPAPIAARVRVVLEEGAFEGRHTLELIATDSLGSKTVQKQMLVVNSTESLSAATGLRVGARGADVTALHKALLEQKAGTKAQLLADIQAKTYGAATRTAVKSYQSREGIDSDGVAGATTISALTLRIVVNLSTHQLTLFSSGDVVKTWGVAVGAPEFPTPTGDFEIQSMQKNPTWTPPDSEWAKDAEVIPPGPDNPLGTRWMGIDGTV
ncbi:MAG: ErfK/YbiS/YcfS/YnhG family protein, partial [Thermoleophilia bacterium]|nr:ErfK/YbiS/YcfS/YnhG family protein [Thermoleophilia bacterium]